MQLAGTTAAGGSNSKPRISLRFFDLTQLHKDTKKGTPKKSLSNDITTNHIYML